MRKFETVFRVTSLGNGSFEAGEAAGDVVDVTRMKCGGSISCSPARLKLPIGFEEDYPGLCFYGTYIRIITEGDDPINAAEDSGAVFDLEKMQPGMTITCIGTYPLYEGEKNRELGGLLFNRRYDRYKEAVSILCYVTSGTDLDT